MIRLSLDVKTGGEEYKNSLKAARSALKAKNKPKLTLKRWKADKRYIFLIRSFISDIVGDPRVYVTTPFLLFFLPGILL